MQAEPNVPCFDGNTALHLAVGKDHLGLAALLVAAGADPYLENYDCAADEELDLKQPGVSGNHQADKGEQQEEEEEEPQGLTAMDLAAGNIKVRTRLVN